MCTLVYLASDGPLPTIAWDPDHPAFHVIELQSPEAAKLQPYFRKRHIYYLGAHEKCGCGFQYGQYPLADDDPEQMAQKTESTTRLAEYVSRATELHGSVEIFSFYEHPGDAVTGHVTLKANEFGREPFWFIEGQLVTVVRGDA